MSNCSRGSARPWRNWPATFSSRRRELRSRRPTASSRIRKPDISPSGHARSPHSSTMVVHIVSTPAGEQARRHEVRELSTIVESARFALNASTPIRGLPNYFIRPHVFTCIDPRAKRNLWMEAEYEPAPAPNGVAIAGLSMREARKPHEGRPSPRRRAGPEAIETSRGMRTSHPGGVARQARGRRRPEAVAVAPDDEPWRGRNPGEDRVGRRGNPASATTDFRGDQDRVAGLWFAGSKPRRQSSQRHAGRGSAVRSSDPRKGKPPKGETP
ncbi:MAG: hypothetical protein FD129_313 [bacterium]|nr:MAG: hypothetical protein FD129_313 [bacterium]